MMGDMNPRPDGGFDPRRPVVLESSCIDGPLPTVYVITDLGPGDAPALLMPALSLSGGRDE